MTQKKRMMNSGKGNTPDFPKEARELIDTHRGELGSIDIAGRIVGRDKPVFIVAEAACNHMCNMVLAKEMIDAAVEAGADSIKFQTYKAEKLVTSDAMAFWGDEKVSQVEYYRKLDRFGRKEYEELFAYASSKGIIAFSSPFDEESATMLFDVGMPLFKIASCDIPDLRQLRQIARFGRPIILSTGASSEEEIDRAIMTIFEQGNFKLMLLACTLSYPTEFSDANLLRIQTLQERYPGVIIGISDHTPPDPNMIIPSVAVSLGARIIEKHYTIDRSMKGSGHFFAMAPSDLKKMVENVRLTETLFGDGKLGVASSEIKAWNSARRSIVAEIKINKGETITSSMLGIKRPAVGLPASRIDDVVGKKALANIRKDQPIMEDLFE